MSDEISQKIVRLSHLRDSLRDIAHSRSDEYNNKYKSYLRAIDQYNKKSREISENRRYRNSYKEVYTQILGTIRQLDTDIQEKESDYDRELLRLSSLDRDIERSNADIRVEISNCESYGAYGKYGNATVSKQYAVGLLEKQREKHVKKITGIREEIESLKQERNANSRMFSDMNATIISWLDEDKDQQALSRSIDAQLVELRRIDTEVDDIKEQMRDVEYDLVRYRQMLMD